MYGVTYAYLLHHLVNLVSAWLVAIHFCSGGVSLSLSDFSQILDGGALVDGGGGGGGGGGSGAGGGGGGEGDMKKRP